ncbi:histidine phosphatase family protein [Nocardioides sp.]|uniref:SixA phosphatase family protein n=1 Tax=Nocardioides sp. TaxID=35761 RepID=UPI00271AC8D8|nr:histidine phosphatase family protein [Nocardioides sp.]MDO9457000.1 histidine phosphatase family protein [Nocardioides sp.]
MAEPLRTLVVMRHAKAEPAAATDFERPLSARGHDDAVDAGSWLRDHEIVPDRALVSAALRTRETWQHLSDGAGWDLAPELDEGLYAADVDTALDLVRLLPDDVTTAVVVGHNPTMASLAQLLDDGEGDDDATAEMTIGTFPTTAAAVLTFAGPWADLGQGTASLAAYHVGRAG